LKTGFASGALNGAFGTAHCSAVHRTTRAKAQQQQNPFSKHVDCVGVMWVEHFWNVKLYQDSLKNKADDRDIFSS